MSKDMMEERPMMDKLEMKHGREHGMMGK